MENSDFHDCDTRVKRSNPSYQDGPAFHTSSNSRTSPLDRKALHPALIHRRRAERGWPGSAEYVSLLSPPQKG